MLTPALDPLFIAYNTGAGGRILHTICIVRKYFTQQPSFKCPFWQVFGENLLLGAAQRVA
jgi:hypothetical protein